MTRASSLAACLAACFAIAAPASAAGDEPVIGSDGHGRMRVLDPDLRIVPGTPALPRTTDGTVLSPDGRRFASWSFSGKRLTIRSRRTFRPQRRLPIAQGSDVFWPTRDRILTVVSTNQGKRPNVIRSFNLARGTSRTLRLRDLPQAMELRGRTLRLLTVRGPDLCCPTGPFVLTDVSAAGIVKQRWRVPLPAGFEVSDDSDGGVAVRLSANRLYATTGHRHALIKVHSGEMKRLTGLADGYYDWVGRHNLYEPTGSHAARIDRGALTVTGTVDTGVVMENATPFQDGFIVGFGRARYDASLRRVAANHAPAPVQNFGPLLAHGRLYDLVIDCDDSDRTELAIADAATGAAIGTRRGRWKVGVLGGGYVQQPFFDDVCD
jgi:hypothetical protein